MIELKSLILYVPQVKYWEKICKTIYARIIIYYLFSLGLSKYIWDIDERNTQYDKVRADPQIPHPNLNPHHYHCVSSEILHFSIFLTLGLWPMAWGSNDIVVVTDQKRSHMILLSLCLSLAMRTTRPGYSIGPLWIYFMINKLGWTWFRPGLPRTMSPRSC